MTSNVTIVAVAAGVYLAAWGLDEVVPDGPTRVALKGLSYENGLFTQEHLISGSGALSMDWTAEINRENRQLCSGGGTAPYSNENPKSFTADDWTGDVCPELQTGDEAFAVWEYFDDEGTRVRVSGLVIIEREE